MKEPSDVKSVPQDSSAARTFDARAFLVHMIGERPGLAYDEVAQAVRFDLPDVERSIIFPIALDVLRAKHREMMGEAGKPVTAADEVAQATDVTKPVDPISHTFDLTAARDWLDFMGVDSAKVPLLLKDKDTDTSIPADGLMASIGLIRAMHDHKGMRLFALLQPTDGNGRDEPHITGGRVFSAEWDNGEPEKLAIWPTSYVKTRRDRAQGHWVFTRAISVVHMKHMQTEFCRLYAGKEPGQCDANAFRITQPFRLPGSVTHIDGEVFRVEDVSGTCEQVSPEAFAEAFGLVAYIEPVMPMSVEPVASVDAMRSKPIIPTNGGLRGRIEAAAPHVRLNTEPDQNRAAYYLKNACNGEEWGFVAFHVACKDSLKYKSEAQCRAKWNAAAFKGLDPEKAAAFFFSRAKGRANLSDISKANPSGNGTAATATDSLPTFSVNPKGHFYAQKSRYGSKLWNGLSLAARAVHDAAHASHYTGRNNGRIVPDATHIARMTGLDVRTVKKAIAELIASGLWRVTMESTKDHPGMIELADVGTDSVEGADGKRTYRTPSRTQWAEQERVQGASAPTPGVIKIEHARFGSKAWTDTSVAGQEIVKAMACLKRKEDADEVISPTRHIVRLMTSISKDAYSTGMASAEGTGLVVTLSRPVRGDGKLSLARAGRYVLVQASEAKARPVRKSDELRRIKGRGSSMVKGKADRKSAEGNEKKAV